MEDIRLEIAVEAMKILLNNQGQYRRMTLLSRINIWFGGSYWHAHYDYDFKAIVKSSFKIADDMIEAQKIHKQA